MHQMINKNVNLITWKKKCAVHRLLSRHRMSRSSKFKSNCGLLYGYYLARDKWKYIIIID